MKKQYQFFYQRPRYDGYNEFSGWGSEQIESFRAKNAREAGQYVQQFIRREAQKATRAGYSETIKPVRLTLVLRAWQNHPPRTPAQRSMY